MAWETPRTYATGETITAMILNTDVRENFRWLYSPPGCRAYHGEAQTIAYGGLRQLNLAQTTFDTDSMHDGTVEHGTAPASAFLNFRTAGRYVLAANVTLGVAAWTQSRIGKNDPQVLIAGKSSFYNGTTDNVTVGLKTIDDFAVDDFVYLLAQSSQSPELAAPSIYPHAPNLSAHWMGN